MTEYIELEFHIEPATPETMPIDELFNIVKALTSELGAKNNMHFKEVRSGCACAVINIEKNEFPKVAEKVQEPKSIIKSFDVRRMISADGDKRVMALELVACHV